jgi:AraC family transcriptional regulator
MQGKIISIEGFKAVGITYFGNNQNGEIPNLWQAFNNRYMDIKQKSKSMLCYGICDDEPDSEGRFHYTACSEVDSFEDVPEGMETKVVPKGNYLMYTYVGAIKDLGEFYNNIFAKWLPASEYEMDFRAQFELYDERFMHNGEFDIYVPIK